VHYGHITLFSLPSRSTQEIKMSKTLSLVEHGSFFDDAFFKDAWEEFDQAMQGVLDKFENKGTKISSSNRTSSTETYRQIRNANIGKDLYASQALQITEKDGKFNAVMDVKDFNPKDLSVRVVDDRVVVEGKFEQKSEDGSSVAAKEFYKEFNMPPSADIDQVATALSKDGILTVKAPKREGDVPTGGPVTQSSASKTSSMQASSNVSDDGTSTKKMQSSSSSFSSSSSSNTMTSGGMPGMMGGMMNMDDMAKDMKDRLGAGSLMSSEFGDMKSSLSSSSSMSSSKVVQMSSKSSFSSSSSSTMTSGMNMMGGGGDMLDDMSKDMQDRLIFSHETANIKLPEKN